jgi:fluoroquinolone transport system permease protein
MNRLSSTVRWDITVQFRQGLYYAAAFVIVLWSLLLRQLPQEGVEWFLPFGLYIDLSVFGFYFMAGILYLEKGEGVLEALVVTPMRRGEYLSAKLISLTLITLLVSVAVVLFVWGIQLNWLMLILAVVLNSWLLTLTGFIIAARYDSINEFLIPSIVFMLPTQLPLLAYFGIWDSWLIYLVPTMPAMIMLEAAFRPVESWQLIYSLLYLPTAAVAVTFWARRVYDQFVVRGEGGK